MPRKLPRAIRNILILLLGLCHANGIEGADSCKHGRRLCVSGATCANGWDCVCDSSYGNGFFQCLEADQTACFVSGDPHLSTFAGAESSIDIPCRYKVTQFQKTDSATGTECHFQVFGVNKPFPNGVFYLDEMEVNVTIAKGVNSNTLVLDYIVSQGFGLYQLDSGRPSLFNEAVSKTVVCGTTEIYLAYDATDHFFSVAVPDCETTFKFRPYSTDVSQLQDQLRTPGLAVLTNAPTISDSSPTFTTSSVCLSGQDSSSQFDTDASSIGLTSANFAVLYRFLENIFSANQHVGEYETSCKTSQDSFTACPLGRRSGAINLCGQLLSDRSLVDCALTASIDFMHAFSLCLQGYCQETKSICESSESLLGVCNTLDQGCASYT